MANNDIEIKVVVDADGAVKVIDKLGQEIEQTGQEANKAGSGFSNMQARVVSLQAAIDLASRAFNFVTQNIGAAFDELQRATILEGVDNSFSNLQESIGRTAGEALPELRTATQGLITDFDLMQAANKAVLLGVDQGKGDFDDLAAAAIKLGAAMGQEAGKSIDDVTTALGRGSVQILDNLGVTLKLEDAYKRYAEILGKSADTLTDYEKKQAFLVVGTEKIIDKASQLSDIQLTAGQSAIILSNSFKNARDEFIKGVSSSNDLGQALQDLATYIAEIDWKAFGADIGSVAKDLIELAKTIKDVVTPAFDGLVDIIDWTNERVAKNIAGNADYEKSLDNILNLIEKQTPEAIAKAVKAYEDLAAASSPSQLAAYRDELNNLYVAIEDSGKEFDVFETKIKDTDRIIKDHIDTVVEETDAQNKSREEREKLIDSISNQAKVVDQSLIPALEDLLENQIKTGTATQDEKDALEKLAEGYIRTADDAEVFKNSIGQATDNLKAQEDAARESAAAIAELNDYYNELFADLATTAIEGTFDLINADTDKQKKEIIADTISAIESSAGEAVGKSIAGDIGGAIGKKLGEIEGNFIGEMIGQAFFGKHFEKVARENFAETIQGMVDDLNILIGDNVVDLGEVFSAQDAPEAWRELAREIQGTAEETAFVNDAFRGFFENLRTDTEEGIATFNGFIAAGDAFAQLFEEMGLTADQFGSILAKNVGGELNNLQILLGQLQISQEDFAAALEQAYLTGNIAAGEYIRDLDAIRDLYQKGIPGAVGATDEAFKNLIEGGLIDGAHAADALGDIMVEAAEAGITNFEGLRQKLIDSGFEVETVDKFFQALAANGIESMEQLGDLTTEQVARIINALESVDFPFLDDASDKLDDIKQKLDAIEEEKHIKVYVEYIETGSKPDEGQGVSA